MEKPSPPEPFGPIEIAANALLTVISALLITFVVTSTIALANGRPVGMSYATIGGPETCVASHHSVGTFSGADVPDARPIEGVTDLRTHAATARADEWTICLKNASELQWAAARVEPVGQTLFALGTLLLIRWTIRGARSAGLFTAEAARRTRRLGWFVLLSSCILPYLSAAGRGVVYDAAIRNYPWQMVLAPHLSIVLIVVGLGILSFARILRLAVPLQDEVDTTI
jgi:hypothetical protein